ncbi:MAG: hypothetical protein LC109_13355, partial [Bacteroidia bacterium]|nr:hypothetical protein [Bacteroidia bacterium]
SILIKVKKSSLNEIWVYRTHFTTSLVPPPMIHNGRQQMDIHADCFLSNTSLCKSVFDKIFRCLSVYILTLTKQKKAAL